MLRRYAFLAYIAGCAQACFFFSDFDGLASGATGAGAAPPGAGGSLGGSHAGGESGGAGSGVGGDVGGDAGSDASGGMGGAPPCKEAVDTCTSTTECCGNLECGMTTAGQVCCGKALEPCNTINGEDCCGALECGMTTAGQVCCGMTGEPCTMPGGEDCCGALECINGHCG